MVTVPVETLWKLVEVTKLSKNIKEELRASTQQTCNGLSRIFFLIAGTSPVQICPFKQLWWWSASYDHGGLSPPTFWTWTKSQNLPLPCHCPGHGPRYWPRWVAETSFWTSKTKGKASLRAGWSPQLITHHTKYNEDCCKSFCKIEISSSCCFLFASEFIRVLTFSIHVWRA